MKVHQHGSLRYRKLTRQVLVVNFYHRGGETMRLHRALYPTAIAEGTTCNGRRNPRPRRVRPRYVIEVT
jgi:hypothetical protein